MSSKKHDLEIVYSLRWKNRSKREESKEMSVVVVVYDIPSTTLNFETFKNYLLKNSGTAENDVRVYFVMENGKEYLIQSQIDFQVALYAFRRKARAGEMINLLLQRVSEQPTHKNLRHSNDVETQFDNAETTSILSTCCNADTAPEWFIAALAQLKKDIKDEITSNVSTLITSAVAEIKSPCLNAVPAQHASCSNRARAKPYKWSRKLTPQLVENITDTKVLLKSLKLENKLDKLERKASKYREKRHALQHGQKSSDNAPKSSDSEAGPSGTNSRSIGKEIKRKLEEVEPTTQKQAVDSKMGARPVSRQRSVPHMLGGEIYLHQWEVQNTGEAQWTPMTQLQYTWGSKKLIPLTQYISVPHLKPGEIGTISIRLHIPSHPGIYECYWQFLHKGRRFGDWLDVQVIVDPFDLKGHSSVLEHSGPQACHFINPSELQENVGKIKEPRQILLQEDLLLEAPTYKSLQDQDKIDRFKLLNQMGKMSLEAEAKSELLNRLIKEDDVDSDCSWASETEHFCPKGSEMVEVMAPVPQCFALDSPDTTDNQAKTPAKQAAAESSVDTPDLKPNKAGSSESFDDNNNTDCASRSSVNSIKFRDEELDNIVVITVPEDEQVKEGFMYVHVDGQKVLIPKTILKSEIISAVQEFDSHLSASSSTGIAIDASETLNKSPTPSIASTIMNQDTEVNGANKPKQENLISAESFELFCDLQEYPSCAQQAVDLTVGPRENFDTSTTIDEALDRSNYFEANNFMSHCSAAGSCFSEFNANAERQTRMFVFPQDVPGYEVIYPTLDSNPEEATLTTDSCVAPKPNQRASVVSLEATSHPLEAVPNYQQTPVELRRSPVQSPQAIVRDTEPAVSEPASTHPPQQPIPEQTTQYPPNADSGWGPAPRPHILPEGLVSGAVSAARSVMNMIRPQSPGRWVNGHWVSSSLETPREANLQALAEMGFWNRDLNATLLARYSDDLNRVVAELVQ